MIFDFQGLFEWFESSASSMKDSKTSSSLRVDGLDGLDNSLVDHCDTWRMGSQDL